MINALTELAQIVWRTLAVIIMIIGLGAEGTYRRTAPHAQMYLAALVITAGAALCIVPLLLFFKMLSGWSVFAYLAALTAMVFTLGLSLLWSPLGILIGMWQGHTVNPLTTGERYIRTVGIILFAETMLTMFVLFVPFHKNLGMLPLFLLATTAVALSTAIWGGYLGAGFYKLVATLVFLVVTASFFLPQTFVAIESEAGTVDQQLALAISAQPHSSQSQGAQPAAREIRLPVGPGPNGWCRWITEILPETRPNISTPGDWLEYKFRDGRIIHKEGDRRFYANAQGDSIAPASIRFPDRDFQIRASSPGEAIITW